MVSIWQSEIDRHLRSVRGRWPRSRKNRIKPNGLPTGRQSAHPKTTRKESIRFRSMTLTSPLPPSGLSLSNGPLQHLPRDDASRAPIKVNWAWSDPAENGRKWTFFSRNHRCQNSWPLPHGAYPLVPFFITVSFSFPEPRGPRRAWPIAESF
jgi:hypothetical protein